MRRINALLLLTAFLLSPAPAVAGEILVYAGAGLMKPLQELAANFEQKNQCRVSVHYGGSGEIFGLMQTGKMCDVFIPGAAQYTQKARQRGWIAQGSTRDLVLHVPVIAVPGDNPAGIRSLQDLVSTDAEIALGDPRACAIGSVSVQILKNKGIYQQAREKTRVFTSAVNQLLLYISTGQVDGTIIWSDLADRNKQGEKIRTLQIDPHYNVVKTIPTAVTSKASEKELARKFNSHLDSERAMQTWKKWGFKDAEDGSP